MRTQSHWKFKWHNNIVFSYCWCHHFCMHKLLGKKSGINKGWEIFLEFFYSRICLCCLRKSNFCFQTWASKINKTSFSAKNDHFRLNLVRTTVSPPRCRSRPSHYILFLLSLTLCLLDYFVSSPERRLSDFFFFFLQNQTQWIVSPFKSFHTNSNIS